MNAVNGEADFHVPGLGNHYLLDVPAIHRRY